jgi:formate-dependent nitrite reductase membrane component NrfD
VHLYKKKNCYMHCFWEKALQKPTFWMNFKEIFFPYYIVWLWMLFLVILYLLEHVKVKYVQKSNKSLVSAFCKEKFISFKNSWFEELGSDFL